MIAKAVQGRRSIKICWKGRFWAWSEKVKEWWMMRVVIMSQKLMSWQVNEEVSRHTTSEADRMNQGVDSRDGVMHIWMSYLWFLPRHAMHISAAIAGMRCLSVCPSVCLSRSWVAPKRIKISSKFFHRRLAKPFYSSLSLPKGWSYSDGNPPNGGVECKGVWKNDDFRPTSRSISETVIVRWAHAARQFVSIEFSFHPYNI